MTWIKGFRKLLSFIISPELSSELIELRDKLDTMYKEEQKEEYYNNKYPKTDITYAGRVVPNSNKIVDIDVRNFFDEYDSEIRKVVEELELEKLSDDKKALACLKWVVSHIKYVGDKTKGNNEFWQFGYETLYYKTGDCEDGAILLMNMLLIAGVPYWKLRPSAGLVQLKGKKIGHAYLTYYCQSGDNWVILDWCYWPNNLYIENRPDYKDEKNYLNVWFSWNKKYCFSKGLNTEAKEILKTKVYKANTP